jgi:adenine-specific DNA-methyltransferase
VTKVKTKKKPDDTVDQYTFDNETRKNNPPVGLVTPGTDPDQPNKKYFHDPYLDPQLQWTGKKENTEFEIDTVSLHVHERIDPLTIIEKTMKQEKTQQETLFHYFETPKNNPPLRDAIEFYKHDQNWSNRIIAGDSLLIMNSLLEKESMGGDIQMIYIDPPYGIKYGSNFQPFVNKKSVKDGKDEDLTQEPETIKAFRDTWELGIHSYLTYLRDRLVLAKELLHESGSIFVQINDDNLHYIKQIMDEVFDKENFVNIISFRKRASYLEREGLFELSDYIIWFAKDYKKMKFRRQYTSQNFDEKTRSEFKFIEDNGKTRKITTEDILDKKFDPKKVFRTHSAVRRNDNPKNITPIKINNKTISPPTGYEWKSDEEGMKKLIKENRLVGESPSRMYKIYFGDFPYSTLTNSWNDTIGEQFPIYAVQTDELPIQRCVLMTTDPGDLIFDPTCGSGTTAYVAEQWGRRWITCDTSRVSISLTKQRIMSSNFDYYELANPEGINGNFKYEMAKHVTLSSIAKNKTVNEETLFDKPIINNSKQRISGPFTVEAVPSPIVKAIDEFSEQSSETSQIPTHNKETSSQEEWRDELLKTGIRGKSGQKIEFTSVVSHPATKWLHADAETKEDKPKRVMVSFGPEHAPLEQRQVALAIEEVQSLVPRPGMIIFAAMQFDPEAAKDIDELNWPGVVILKAEMNKDLITKDLKKKRSSNESFWLMGQPDVELLKIKNNEFVVTVNGFDYYNTRTGEVESGDSSKIVMWMIDTDYDGRSIYPQQVFFPMDGKHGGWNKLAKTLQAQIDEELIIKYQGTESIPFKSGFNKRIAVKIIDDRGIESVKIIKLE